MSYLLWLLQVTNNFIVLTFLATGIFLTFITKFPQLRLFKKFIQILTSKKINESTEKTLSPLQAVFTAMSTTLGAGAIIAPSIAITIGGPGALFWMVAYAFFGSVIKYTEVTFAVKFKRYAPDGTIVSGPIAYLHQINRYLADWYGILTIFLFSSWSALQAKSLSATYAHQNVPEYFVGIVLAIFVFFMLSMGTKSIGRLASKTVPTMCLIYFLACCSMLIINRHAIIPAFGLMFASAFSSSASIGGFIGVTLLTTIKQGISKAAFITEAGIGTAGIPHSLANSDEPTNQGILAMYSVYGDTFFIFLSGMIILTSGVWKIGQITNDMPLLAFKSAMPLIGPIAYTITATLFMVGTTLGNSFNGSKSFAFFTNNRFMYVYYGITAICIFLGTIINATALWQVIDFIIPLTAAPNIFGIIILAFKNRKEIEV